MTSPDGIAIATWITDIIGIVAIVVAVYTFYASRQQNRADLLRLERDRIDRFVAYCGEVVATAEEYKAALSTERQNAGQAQDANVMSGSEMAAVSKATRLMLDVVAAMRQSAPPDARLIKAISQILEVGRYLDERRAQWTIFSALKLAPLLLERCDELDDAIRAIENRAQAELSLRP